MRNQGGNNMSNNQQLVEALQAAAEQLVGRKITAERDAIL